MVRDSRGPKSRKSFGFHGAGGLRFATALRYEGLNDEEEVYKYMRIYLWSGLRRKGFEDEQEKNPKSQNRNPKQIPITEALKPQTKIPPGGGISI